MNLKAEKRLIDETDHIPTRSERSQETKQTVLSEQDRVAESISKYEGDREANPMGSLARMMRLHGPLFFLAIILFAADVPIQCGLTSIAFPSLYWVILVIVSILITAGIGAIVEVSAFALLFDPYRLSRTFRLCLTCAGLAGVVAAVSGTILLFSRTASGNAVAFLVQAVPIAFWTLGESLPIAAGFLSAAVWTLGYPKRRDRQIERLKARVSELGRFLDWLENDIKQHAGRIAVMMLVCAFLSMPAFSQGAFGPPSGAASGVVTASGNMQTKATAKVLNVLLTSPSGKTRCLVASDMTESVDPEFRRIAVSLFTRSANRFVTAFQCSVVSAGVFGDEGPFTLLTEIQVPPPPTAQDCTKATFTVDGVEKITQHIGGFEAYYKKRAEEACQVAVQSRIVESNQKAQDFTQRVAAILNPDLPTRGECTALYSLMSWAIRRNNVVAILSDGLETCEQTRPALKVPSGTRLFLILLPSRTSTHKAGGSAFQIAAAWQAIAPGLRVVMPSEVTPDLWSDLAAPHLQPGDGTTGR